MLKSLRVYNHASPCEALFRDSDALILMLMSACQHALNDNTITLMFSRYCMFSVVTIMQTLAC